MLRAAGLQRCDDIKYRHWLTDIDTKKLQLLHVTMGQNQGCRLGGNPCFTKDTTRMAGSYGLLAGPLRAGATIAVLTAMACMGPRWAQAADPGYEVQVGIIESDNIQRLPTGGSDETIAMEELDFDWHEKRPWFDADIDGDISHVSYLEHTYGDEFIGNFIGTSKINLIEDLFAWNIADNFGQTPLNPLAPITPANRENINYFNTGPVLTLPLGQELQVIVTGQYGRVDYQEAPLDNNRLTGIVGLGHEISPTTNISINAKDERVDFADDQLNPDYQTQEAFGRFDTKGSRTELGVDVGYGRQVMPGVNNGNFIARLNLTRRVSPNSTIGLSLGHDYSDGADAFLLIQAVGGATLNTQNAVQAGAPFLVSYAALAWNYKYDRTTVDLTVSHFRNDYQLDEALNSDLTMGTVRAARQLTPELQLALSEYIDRQHFSAGDDSATEADTGLQMTWRAGRNLSLVFAYYLAKGTGSVAADKFTENRLWLSVGYGRAAEVPPGPEPVRLPGQAPGQAIN
jgi:hypothetical protein